MSGSSASARVLPFRGARSHDEDAEILAAAAGGERERAAALLFDRYGEHVRRILHRILGASDEVQDARQVALLRVLDRLSRVESGAELRGFVSSVSAFVAREHLRSKKRRGWLHLFAPEDVPEHGAPEHDDEGLEAVRAVYSVLDQLDTDDRIAFCMRVIDGMELTEVAAACEVSLATVKRRIAHAQERFLVHAQKQPALTTWVRATGDSP